MLLSSKNIKPVKAIYFLLFVALTFSACGGKPKVTPDPVPPPVVTPGTTFTNPLLSSGPDPWVVKKDNFYYYTHTLGNRIGVWKTQKMSELKNVSATTVWTMPASGANSNNVWAPELHYINSKWYAYYTAGSSASDLNTQRTFVLENASDDPTVGTWVDKGKIYDPAADFFAIDGTILNYNGSNYFIWSGHATGTSTDNTQRLYIARMINPWTLETSRSLISSPQYSWETIGGPVNEGPEILKNAAGKVFLIYSASGCWTDDYALGMLTLTGSDPLAAASWTKTATPVFTKNVSGGAFGPGHNTFFKSLDGTEDWILYHANPTANLDCKDFRSPRMQMFTWNADGTPNFGQPVAIGAAIKKPSGE